MFFWAHICRKYSNLHNFLCCLQIQLTNSLRNLFNFCTRANISIKHNQFAHGAFWARTAWVFRIIAKFIRKYFYHVLECRKRERAFCKMAYVVFSMAITIIMIYFIGSLRLVTSNELTDSNRRQLVWKYSLHWVNRMHACMYATPEW